MTEKTSDNSREKFIQAYSNLPLNARKEIILVLEEENVKQPITWEVAYLEIKTNSPRSQKILDKLNEMKLL